MGRSVDTAITSFLTQLYLKNNLCLLHLDFFLNNSRTISWFFRNPPIKVWAKSVKGFVSGDRTYKQTLRHPNRLPYIITYLDKWTICVLLFTLLLLCLDIRIIGDGIHINIDIDLLLLFVHPPPTPTYTPLPSTLTPKKGVFTYL